MGQVIRQHYSKVSFHFFLHKSNSLFDTRAYFTLATLIIAVPMGITILSGLCSILNRVGNSLIRSFLVNNLSKLLMVAHFLWATWVICSHHSFLAGLGICSFAQIAQIKWVTVSNLLRSLRTNERLWANRSGRSCQKSDWEWIAQVAHDKWSTVSNSLRLIHDNWVNEQITYFFWANLFALFSLLLSKTSNLHKKFD